MVPNCNPNVIGSRNPKLGAASESNCVVIEYRRNNQCTVENPSKQDSVLELRELVAEPTVGCVPEELFP
jgi:hypothetical protein